MIRNKISSRQQMHISIVSLLTVLLTFQVSSSTNIHEHEGNLHYINEWVVNVRGGRAAADKLASEHNYENVGTIENFPDLYLFRKRDVPTRTKRSSHHLTKRLAEDDRVEWVEQQFAKQRDKRDIWSQLGYRQAPVAKSKDCQRFNDPLWCNQWYLMDTRTNPSLPSLHLNVLPVWDRGFTGKGQVVSILDDGLEWNHTDLVKNYDPFASIDLNDNDTDPFPRYDYSDSNRHGTRCAGEVAMIPNNNMCGVGVAYEASIGGVRMLDGSVTDFVEAKALSHNISHIDIFSASWGPKDDGKTVEGPGKLASEALRKGATEGRGGKGILYIWAGGNGGAHGDDCNCDGYASSIYTISISSCTQRGGVPWYSESCSSNLAGAFSSGAYTDQKISTADLHNGCTVDHTGTSAAAPLAAGVFALVLHANPNITWRDAQHLTIWTANPSEVMNIQGWNKNGVGLYFNNHIGFGLLDADAMVQAVLKWKNVPPSVNCTFGTPEIQERALSSTNETDVVLSTDGCVGTPGEIQFLEHIQVTTTIEYPRRGVLEATLISPSGTKSKLLSPRPEDTSDKGFQNWTFMSVEFWGENPKGQWKFIVTDKTYGLNKGAIKATKIRIFGTKERPDHMSHIAPPHIKQPPLPPPQPQNPFVGYGPQNQQIPWETLLNSPYFQGGKKRAGYGPFHPR